SVSSSPFRTLTRQLLPVTPTCKLRPLRIWCERPVRLLDRAPAINQASRKPKIVLRRVKQAGVYVIHLEGAHGKAGRNAVVHAATEADHPGRVFLRAPHLD